MSVKVEAETYQYLIARRPCTITPKISETNSSFHIKKRKNLVSIFQEFSCSINKTFTLARIQGTRL